jgi:nucleotide-binding universal stress UspA family protein
MANKGEATRIMISLNGHEMDEETIRIACQMAPKRPGVKVYAVHVLEVNRSLPLGAVIESQVERGEEILAKAETLVAEYENLECETELVQARDTGPAIVGEAEEWKADLIVMGLPYKRRFGDFNLGKTVPYVLKFASCQVILFREHLEQ